MGRLRIHRRASKRLGTGKAVARVGAGKAVVLYEPDPRSAQDRLKASADLMFRMHQVGKGAQDLSVAQLRRIIADFKEAGSVDTTPMENVLRGKLLTSQPVNDVGSVPPQMRMAAPISRAAIMSFNPKTGMMAKRSVAASNPLVNRKRGKGVNRYRPVPSGRQVWRYLDPSTRQQLHVVGPVPGAGPPVRYVTRDGLQQMSWVPPFMRSGPQPQQYIRNGGKPLNLPNVGRVGSFSEPGGDGGPGSGGAPDFGDSDSGPDDDAAPLIRPRAPKRQRLPVKPANVDVVAPEFPVTPRWFNRHKDFYAGKKGPFTSARDALKFDSMTKRQRDLFTALVDVNSAEALTKRVDELETQVDEGSGSAAIQQAKTLALLFLLEHGKAAVKARSGNVPYVSQYEAEHMPDSTYASLTPEQRIAVDNARLNAWKASMNAIPPSPGAAKFWGSEANTPDLIQFGKEKTFVAPGYENFGKRKAADPDADLIDLEKGMVTPGTAKFWSSERPSPKTLIRQVAEVAPPVAAPEPATPAQKGKARKRLSFKDSPKDKDADLIDFGDDMREMFKTPDRKELLADIRAVDPDSPVKAKTAKKVARFRKEAAKVVQEEKEAEERSKRLRKPTQPYTPE